MAAPPEGRKIVIKKKGGGHGHHGGAWKVAYADFVTAMMALFMVMWLLASTDQQSRQEISRYFRTGILPDGDMAMNRAAQLKPSVIEEAPTPTNRKTAAIDEAQMLKTEIQKLIKSDPDLEQLAALVSVSVNEEGVLIETVDRDGKSMLFDLASSQLKPALIEFLHKLAPMLGQRGSKIRLMGHTDARPYVSRSGKTNWDLSYERAGAARKVLESSGLLKGQIVSVQAHGSSQLRNPADPFAAENRRLSILVLHTPGPEEAAPEGAEAPVAAQPGAEIQPGAEPVSPGAVPATAEPGAAPVVPATAPAMPATAPGAQPSPAAPGAHPAPATGSPAPASPAPATTPGTTAPAPGSPAPASPAPSAPTDPATPAAPAAPTAPAQPDSRPVTAQPAAPARPVATAH